MQNMVNCIEELQIEITMTPPKQIQKEITGQW